MKATLFFISLLLLLNGALAQSGSAGRSYQRTRGIERSYDLPYLTVDRLTSPQVADHLTVVVYAPDSMRLSLSVEQWMQDGQRLCQRSVMIGPGRQDLTLPLQGLAEGTYTLLVERRGQVLGAKHFLLER